MKARHHDIPRSAGLTVPRDTWFRKQSIIDDNRDHDHWSTVLLIILETSFSWKWSALMESKSQKRSKGFRDWYQNKDYREMLPDQKINIKFWVLSSLAQKLYLFGICRSVDWSRSKKRVQVLEHELQRRVSNQYYFGFYSVFRARERQWTSDSLTITQSMLTPFLGLSPSLNHNIDHWFWVFLLISYDLLHFGCNILHWCWALLCVWQTLYPGFCNIRRESSTVLCFSCGILLGFAMPFTDLDFFPESEATLGNLSFEIHRLFW
jgi:hypothetical protein